LLAEECPGEEGARQTGPPARDGDGFRPDDEGDGGARGGRRALDGCPEAVTLHVHLDPPAIDGDHTPPQEIGSADELGPELSRRPMVERLRAALLDDDPL